MLAKMGGTHHQTTDNCKSFCYFRPSENLLAVCVHPVVEFGKPCNQPSFLLPDSLMNIIKLQLKNTSFLSQYASLLGELGDYLFVSTDNPCHLSGTRQLSVSPVPWDYLIWSLFLHVGVVGVTLRDWALPPTTTCGKGILGQQ